MDDALAKWVMRESNELWPWILISFFNIYASWTGCCCCRLGSIIFSSVYKAAYHPFPYHYMSLISTLIIYRPIYIVDYIEDAHTHLLAASIRESNLKRHQNREHSQDDCCCGASLRSDNLLSYPWWGCVIVYILWCCTRRIYPYISAAAV